ncbi:GyrI-like domain-containing protein [Arthrobacter sp. PAMC 25486]|uniref:GyrI-like domain-containing protein n=1 Tax=Arthrobacter sp. PAMC 25486 TaxID=1494608 RepID=UPI0009DD3594|nr:GyrI-like domain-containing protein [Arthrobacter sp. PAMC 25486]
MEKYDVKRALRPLYAPSAKNFSLVKVPPMRFLAIDGHGDPNVSAAYAEAVEALYASSYALKFHSKKELDRDYVVAPLEGLWWAEDMAAFTAGGAGGTDGASRDKAGWDWTMMISQPDWITTELVTDILAQVAAKKELPGLSRLRIDELYEGLSVQILHIGPYDNEGPVLARLHHEFMPANNLAFNGKHHEIYLSDPRRSSPEKLKTILRQPVAPASSADPAAAANESAPSS